MFEQTLKIGEVYEKLNPNVFVDNIDNFGDVMIEVFTKFGLGVRDIPNIIDTLVNHKRDLAHRNDPLKIIYGGHTDVGSFFRMYQSCCVSKAQCERLFSFLKRQSATFMRKSLNVKTLTHLGRIYVAEI
ncbi:MAG: hypothetical protein EOM50_24220 [Erysipelotrichia bacterium]|nr:hypothetical protein [Erysipelotrichia bacterium]